MRVAESETKAKGRPWAPKLDRDHALCVGPGPHLQSQPSHLPQGTKEYSPYLTLCLCCLPTVSVCG